MAKTLILSDESLNNQGFWVKTSGINLTQFKRNPVMFYNHDRGNLPIGRWENIRVDGDKLLADPVFDLSDKFAAEIARKYEEGFINMCSISAKPVEWSDSKELIKPGQIYSTVTKAKLKEVSIVDIGANDNSVRLCDDNGVLINLSDSGSNVLPKIKKENMSKVKEYLELKDEASDTDVELAVKKLKDERDQLKKEVEEIKLKEVEIRKQRAVVLVDAAIKDGKITAAVKDTYLKLFDSDFDSTEKVLSDMPVRAKLSDMTSGGVSTTDPILSLSWDDIDKKNKLAWLKETHPTVYEQKFNERFKK